LVAIIHIYIKIHKRTFLFQPQKGKQGTKGQKQIVEENTATLNFYRNMVFIANGIYLTVTCIMSDTYNMQMIVSLYISA